MDIWYPERLGAPQRITPQRCLENLNLTVQPARSASRNTPSTSFFGCLLRGMVARYNNVPALGVYTTCGRPILDPNRAWCKRRQPRRQHEDWQGSCRLAFRIPFEAAVTRHQVPCNMGVTAA